MYNEDSSMLNIASKKQIFFDNVMIEAVQDITRSFHQPKKVDQNPLLVKDKPWEHVLLIRTGGYRVFYDREDKLFKCVYTDEDFHPEKYTVPGSGLEMLSMGVVLYRQLYAYSEDGINWVKPQLGIFKESEQGTNVIWGDKKFGSVYDCYIIDDPFESDKSRRFKTLYVRIAPGDIYRIEAAYSADGIHWNTYNELPSFGKVGPHLGDVLTMSYDLDSRQYILTTRYPGMTRAPLNPRNPKTSSFFPPYYPNDWAKQNKRRIFQCESSDFLHWSEPYMILCPDDEDNLDDSHYGMVQYRIGDTRIGILNVIHQVSDTMDVQLAYSRGGKNWRRVRRPWLIPGPQGSWDQIMVEACNDPIEVGDELWFYYGASGWGHHDWYLRGIAEGLNVPEAKNISKVGFFLGLAKLRLDGFCSLDAGPVREGILITRPFVSEGKRILINAECGEKGHIDVEVVNLADEVFPGYSRKDCDTFQGNEVRHTLSWKGKTDVPVEHFRKLRFYLRNARLYSFRAIGENKESR